MLSEYIDNTLSARDTWEVDRHLQTCHACARTLNELRQTVRAIADAPRYEVSSDFMERLQMRLASVEQKPARPPFLAGLQDIFRPRLLPAWGAALATIVIAAVLLIPRSPIHNGSGIVPQSVPDNTLQMATTQNVALTAVNPFEDLAVSNLTAHASTESGADGETIP
jgi:anti-sigma factor RsiW